MGELLILRGCCGGAWGVGLGLRVRDFGFLGGSWDTIRVCSGCGTWRCVRASARFAAGDSDARVEDPAYMLPAVTASTGVRMRLVPRVDRR